MWKLGWLKQLQLQGATLVLHELTNHFEADNHIQMGEKFRWDIFQKIVDIKC